MAGRFFTVWTSREAPPCILTLNCSFILCIVGKLIVYVDTSLDSCSIFFFFLDRTTSVVGLSIQLLSCVQLFVSPWNAAHPASLSITNSQSLLKLMSIESVMPSNHLILCRPLLLLLSIFPSIRVFSNETVLCIRWPKYWSFSFSISPSNEYSGLIPGRKTKLPQASGQGEETDEGKKQQ